jgi:hypothetical protein
VREAFSHGIENGLEKPPRGYGAAQITVTVTLSPGETTVVGHEICG